jgi:hypothetical protein
MVRAVLLVLVGCHFSSPTTGDSPDATTVDSPAACAISATSAGTPTTSLGGTGGSQRPDLVCAANELPIGVSFESTLAPRPEGGGGAAGERVVTAIHVRCADLMRGSDGSLAVTVQEKTEWIANDCGWGPFVTAPEVLCPANTVLVGMSANRGQTTLFNTVSLMCAPLAGGAVQTVAVVDTGAYSNSPQVASCPSATGVVSFAIRGDCGVDGLTPRCAPLGCR